MDDLSNIVLDDYRPLSEKDVNRIVEAYKRKHPKLYAEWKSIELARFVDEDDPLREISLSVHLFLRENCIVNTNYAAIRAFVRMRKTVGERTHLHRRH